MLRLNQVVYNKLKVISRLPINPVWEDLQWPSRRVNFLAHVRCSCVVQEAVAKKFPCFAICFQQARRASFWGTLGIHEVLMLFTLQALHSCLTHFSRKSSTCLIWTLVLFLCCSDKFFLIG